jgi:outer membrane lipoprotein SlyB|tara:strand:+ start:729 stop:1202 length:474 start_codon:yes stop_codon:yes gene_type:complete
MKTNLIALFVISIILISCNTTKPTDVKKSDTQKITSIKYGNIISSLPVKIKGEGSEIGATAGGLIGGLLGTQICGKELIAGAKCEEIAIVYGTIGGATIGYVTEALLGNHDGYQYVIDVDNSSEDVAIVQGNTTLLENGERVVIIFGNTIRVLPYAE